MLLLSIAINIGMYTERFLIVAPHVASVPAGRLGSVRAQPGRDLDHRRVVALFVTLFLIFVKIFPERVDLSK